MDFDPLAFAILPEPYRELIILVALALDIVLGGYWAAKIGGLSSWFFSLANWLDRKLNRPRRPAKTRAFRGVLAVLVVGGLAALMGQFAARLSSQTFPFLWCFELFIVVNLVGLRSPLATAAAVTKHLRDDPFLDGARQALTPLVNRPRHQMDRSGVVREAIQALGEELTYSLIGPIFAYLAFGLPGLILFSAIIQLNRAINDGDPHHAFFALSVSGLSGLLLIGPGLIATLVIVIAAVFGPRTRPIQAFSIASTQGFNRHPNLGLGFATAAMAGALNVTLLGPRKFLDTGVVLPWLGRREAPARLDIKDLIRARYLYGVAGLLTVMVMIGWTASKILMMP